MPKTRGPYQRAMCGRETRDGDYIELKNQFARVTITIDYQPVGPAIYQVEGDLWDKRGPRTPTRIECNTMAEALRLAWGSLGEYAEGRGD